MWYRRNDKDRLTYQSNDFYVLQYLLTQKQFNVEAFITYQNDRYTGAGTYDDQVYWVGVRGGFRPGNFDLRGTFIYKGGKRDYVSAATTDMDYAAYAAEVEAKYKIGPGMTVGLEGFYATGNDANDKSKIKLYAAPTGSEAEANFGYDRTVFFWMNWSDFCGQHMKQYTSGGFWYARADFEYAPTAKLNLIFNYLYIGDNSSGDPANVTSTSAINTGISAAGYGSRQDRDESFVGHEINVIAKYKIYQNLLWQTGFGYFLPGKIYDSTTKSAENAWAATTHIIYSF
jgi:hypothetical protein